MKHRRHYFMKADKLRSQFEALEEPYGAIVVEISPPPSTIVNADPGTVAETTVNRSGECAATQDPEKTQARLKRCKTIELNHRNFAKKQCVAKEITNESNFRCTRN